MGDGRRFQAHKHWVFIETAKEVCDANEIYSPERCFYERGRGGKALSSSRSVWGLVGKGQFCCGFSEISSGLEFRPLTVEQKKVVDDGWHDFCPIVIAQVARKGGKSNV